MHGGAVAAIAMEKVGGRGRSIASRAFDAVSICLFRECSLLDMVGDGDDAVDASARALSSLGSTVAGGRNGPLERARVSGVLEGADDERAGSC